MATIISSPNSRDNLIKWYFFEGYQYRAIVCFLFFVHGVRISLRQRELQKLNLRRRVQPSANSISRVVSFVLVATGFILCFSLTYWSDMYIPQDELQTSGSLLGYRMMWKRLQLKHKIHIWLFCSHSLEEMDWTAMLESSVFATEDRCRTRYAWREQYDLSYLLFMQRIEAWWSHWREVSLNGG